MKDVKSQSVETVAETTDNSQQPLTPSPAKKKKILSVGLGLIFIIFVSAISFLIYHNNQLRKQTVQKIEPAPIELDQKTYKNEKHGFSFKYSPELGIKELPSENYSAVLSLIVTNENNHNLFNGKLEDSIKDTYFSLTVEIFKNMDKEQIISEHFDMICNSPWVINPSSCKQEKINAFKSYNQDGIQGYTANITPYEQSHTYLIMHFDPYTLFTTLSGPEGIFPSTNAINLRNQILSSFKFLDQTNKTEDWETYTSEKYNFNFKYPNNWLVRVKDVRVENHYFLLDLQKYGTPIDILIDTPIEAGVIKDASSLEVAGIKADRIVEKGSKGNITQETVYFTHNKLPYMVVVNYEGGFSQELQNIYNQILSTFKFTSP